MYRNFMFVSKRVGIAPALSFTKNNLYGGEESGQ